MKKHVFTIPNAEVAPFCKKCGTKLMAGQCPSFMCDANSEGKSPELVKRTRAAIGEEWRYAKND